MSHTSCLLSDKKQRTHFTEAFVANSSAVGVFPTRGCPSEVELTRRTYQQLTTPQQQAAGRRSHPPACLDRTEDVCKCPPPLLVIFLCAMMSVQRRLNQALAEYAYEREELLSRVDVLSREILALRAQMVSDDMSTQSAPFQPSLGLGGGVDRPNVVHAWSVKGRGSFAMRSVCLALSFFSFFVDELVPLAGSICRRCFVYLKHP